MLSAKFAASAALLALGVQATATGSDHTFRAGIDPASDLFVCQSNRLVVLFYDTRTSNMIDIVKARSMAAINKILSAAAVHGCHRIASMLLGAR